MGERNDPLGLTFSPERFCGFKNPDPTSVLVMAQTLARNDLIMVGRLARVSGFQMPGDGIERRRNPQTLSNGTLKCTMNRYEGEWLEGGRGVGVQERIDAFPLHRIKRSMKIIMDQLDGLRLQLVALLQVVLDGRAALRPKLTLWCQDHCKAVLIAQKETKGWLNGCTVQVDCKQGPVSWRVVQQEYRMTYHWQQRERVRQEEQGLIQTKRGQEIQHLREKTNEP